MSSKMVCAETIDTSVTTPMLKRERSEEFDVKQTTSRLTQQRKYNWIDDVIEPVLRPREGESKSQYFARLGSVIDKKKFRSAMQFEKDGLYLYKRPVRTASPEHSMLLSQLGTVMHHVILYVKCGEKLVAFEYGPAADEDTRESMDVTSNLAAEAPAGPIFIENPELPEKEYLPMLHMAVPHHPIDAEQVEKAINFAASRAYQALKNNCIAFADFITRVLTGGHIKNAPLIFDHIVGHVPPVDSPMLPFFQAMLKTTWHEIADGSRLMRDFIEAHGPRHIVPLTHSDELEDEDIGNAFDTDGSRRNGGGQCIKELGKEDNFTDDKQNRLCNSNKISDRLSSENMDRKPKKGISMLPPRKKATTLISR